MLSAILLFNKVRGRLVNPVRCSHAIHKSNEGHSDI